MRHSLHRSLIAAGLAMAALAACKPATEPATGPAISPDTHAAAVAASPASVAPVASSAPATAIKPDSPLTLAAQVGGKLFFDPTLSGSGKMSCATCHDPGHAYGPPNDLAVQLGGADGKTPGTRAVPTLMYKEYTKAYSDAYQNPDMVSAPGPGGGFTWDGRANTIGEQAGIPLLAPNEMANASAAAVVDAVRKGGSADLFRQAFGPDSLDDTDKAFALVGAALQAFQIEDRSFHPYKSKFDLFRNNKIGGALTEAEMRGLRVFLDPAKGNCMACHLIGGGNDGSQDMTSDYSFNAVGVPRNRDIPANSDPAYFDLGLCGPLRADHLPAKAGATATAKVKVKVTVTANVDTDGNGARPVGFGCGMFKTPVLRNVSTRHVFMHNGVFKSIEDVVKFYNTRDTQPERWYPRDAHGKVRKYDDLPARYRFNLDTQMPLDGRKAGGKAPMTDQETADLITFLGTLTDGFVPSAATAGTRTTAAAAAERAGAGANP